MYQDGILVGETTFEGDLYQSEDENMYIRVGSPYYEKNPKYFKGLFDSIGIFNKKLKDTEIK